MLELLIKNIHNNGYELKKAYSGDAGLDLISVVDLEVQTGVVESIPTGISVAIPTGHCGFVLPRSSLGAKGLIIPNSPGLIDSGYRGEIKVLIFNLKDKVYKINAGDKIAQLVILRQEEIITTEVTNLPESQDGRGVGGFGSSGK